jgi:hypothetical protein
MKNIRNTSKIKSSHTAKPADLVLFNANRDNAGKGVKVKDLQKILRALDT